MNEYLFILSILPILLNSYFLSTEDDKYTVHIIVCMGIALALVILGVEL